MKKLILGLMILAVFSGAAEAKHKRKHVARSQVILAHPDCNILWPCIGVGPSPRGVRIAKSMPFGMPQNIYTSARTRPVKASSFAASMPGRFVAGRLKCAVNIGVALAELGIKGTGSAWAKSYLHWGRASGPVPGAVAVFSRGKRGGHVAIVHDVRPDGTVIYLNPSSRRQAWQVGPYGKRPIAFRVAG